SDLLAFVEAVQARSFDRTDMNEHVLAALRRLDEPKTLRGVEPLHGTCGHHSLSLASVASTREHAQTVRSRHRSAATQGTWGNSSLVRVRALSGVGPPRQSLLRKSS